MVQLTNGPKIYHSRLKRLRGQPAIGFRQGFDSADATQRMRNQSAITPTLEKQRNRIKRAIPKPFGGRLLPLGPTRPIKSLLPKRIKMRR